MRRSSSEEPVPCWRSRGGKAVCGGVPGARRGALVSHRLACGPSRSSRFEKVKHELERQGGVLELRTEALPRCPGMPANRGRPLRLRTTAWGGGVGPELCSLTWCSGSWGWEGQAGEGHIQGGHFPPWCHPLERPLVEGIPRVWSCTRLGPSASLPSLPPSLGRSALCLN